MLLIDIFRMVSNYLDGSRPPIFLSTIIAAGYIRSSPHKS